MATLGFTQYETSTFKAANHLARFEKGEFGHATLTLTGVMIVASTGIGKPSSIMLSR